MKALINDIDAGLFIDIIKKKKQVDPDFFFDYHFDEERHCFDSLSERRYALFSDIILFDPTHKANRCTMVFAPFIRLNYHRQLICFMTTLLRDE